MKTKRKILSLLLSVTMIVSMFAGMTVPVSAGTVVWDGTTAEVTWYTSASSEFTIDTAAQLAGFAKLVNEGNDFEGKTVILGGDILLNSDAAPEANEWIPIARYLTAENAVQKPFKGTFNGNGHYVYNLYISDVSGSSATSEGNALFGCNAGTIKNLGITGSVASYRKGAGIVGHNQSSGTIQYCYSNVSVNANGGGSDRGSGGIVGTNYGRVEYCFNRGDIYNGYRRAGGIAGCNIGGSIDHCYNVGTVSSSSSGNAGSITASNENNGSTLASITNCYYLNGSCAEGGIPTAGVGTSTSPAQITVFNNEGVLGDQTSLLNALNNGATGSHYIAAASGKYPVLSWQTGFVWELSTATVEAAVGGTFTAKISGSAITDTVTTGAGTTITLEATAANSGYLFAGFTANEKNIGGTSKTPPYSMTYTLQSDVTLSAKYIATSSTALSVYTQIGNNGYKNLKESYSWEELASMKQTGNYGYMYTHGTTWDVVSATEYVTIDSILSGSAVTPADSDLIVAAASDGEPKVIPTYALLKQQLNFYPGAYYHSEGDSGQPTAGAIQVPAGIALSWGSASVSTGAGVTAADALSEAANQAYNSAKLRFVYGCKEEDYLSKTAMTTIQGNRLWSGVEMITVRTPSNPYDTSADGEIIAAPISEASTSAAVCTNYNAVSSGANVTLSGIDLKSFVNSSDINNDDKGYWVGIAIPVPENISYTAIKIGTNLIDFRQISENEIFTNTEDSKNYVKVYWDSVKDDINNVYVSFDNGNSVKEICVDDSGVSQNVLDFVGTQLSMAQLKAYETTAEYTMKDKKYTVTGIKISDIIKHYVTGITPASLTFTNAANNFSKTADNLSYSWDNAMIIWNMKDSSGKENVSGALRSAVNGSPGNLWISDLATVTAIPADIVIDGTGVTKSQLQAMTTSSAVFTCKGTPYTVTGVKISDMIGGVIKTTPASVTFSSATGNFVSKANNLDYDWDKVMVIWSQVESGDNGNIEKIESGLKSAVDGASGKLWVADLASVVTDKTGLTVNGKYLSTEQLKMHPTTDNYTQLSGSNGKTNYSVTGITFKDLFDNYFGGITPASITIKADGTSKSLKNCDAGWNEGMIIWSKIDSNGTQQISSGLSTAVNNQYGRYWLNAVTDLSTEDADFTFDGKYMSVAQMQSNSDYTSEGAVYSWYKIKGTDREDGTSTVSGITVKSILDNYVHTSPEMITLVAKDGSEISVSEGAFAWDKTMLAWTVDGDTQTPLSSAIDGSMKKYWRSGVVDVKAQYAISFDLSPATATVLVKNSGGTSIDPRTDGSYLLDSGSTYSYTVSANGYTTKTDSIIVKDRETVAVTLNSSSGGGSGGRIDDEDVVFTLSTQQGKSGTPTVVKTYSKSELYGLATTNKSGECYMYYKVDAWEGVVATVYVKLDDLLGDAGVNFDSGDSLIEKAGDGYSSSWTYNDINENCYFFDDTNSGQQSVVPAALALEWDAGSIESGYSWLANRAYYSGSLRFVFGTTENLYLGTGTDWDEDGEDDRAQGNRLGSQITDIIIAYDANLHESSKFSDDDSSKTEPTVSSGAITTGVNGQRFNDVPKNEWFYDAVEYVVEKGLFKGVSEEAFEPGTDMTRAMLVTVMYRYEGSPSTSAITSYGDVKNGEWYSEPVAWADSSGIVKGYSSDQFGSDDSVTREQMAMIMYRYAVYKGYDTTSQADLSGFYDSSHILPDALTAMKWANAEGLMTGVSATSLDPKGKATRAQVAVIIERFAEKYAAASDQ